MSKLSSEEIDWVLFDADHTLFDFDRSARHSLAYMFGEIDFHVTEEQLQLYFKINKACWREYEEGKVDRETLARKRFDIFFDVVGITGVDPVWFNSAYLAQLPNHVYHLEIAEELVKSLRGSYRLGIITNGLAAVQRPRLRRSPLNPHFDIVVVSGEIGLAKPDPAYFAYAHKEMAFPGKERVLVVGDSLYSDIKGGNDYGFRTCWYNPEKSLKEEGIEPEFEVDSHKAILELLVN